MPFQSEKQRRYLWANEPEIARDWTDTYGSGIARALGGRIQYQGGGPGPGGQGARGQATQNPGRSGPSGPPGGGDRQMTYTAPPTRSRIQSERQEDVRQRQMKELIARQQAEKDYTRTGQIKPGPQLGWAGGAGPNLGSMASGFAGSKIGGGLGSMLFGPWGALLGALFGRGVGKRAYQAYQTPEKEKLSQILMPTFAQGLFDQPSTGGEGLGLYTDRIKEPGGTGIETVDIRDKFDRREDDFSEIKGQQAKIVKGALIQKRFIERKMKAPAIYGEPTQREKEIYKQLQEMDKEEKVYSLPIIT